MMIRTLKNLVRRKSFHVCLLNVGSCNGCDIEVLACLAPRYDIEQYGIYVHNNPREADVILVTGAVSDQWVEKIKEIYEKVPEPKAVVAIGSCALSGHMFAEGCTHPPVSRHIPVSAEVPGCPPRPQDIIDAILSVAPIIFRDYDEGGG
ncbi:MAG: energy-converting hydrogenase subunit [Archaeoglobi archaeon]|nr:energy-converting hydrogenase subunit [Archaeoglobi archaeon]MDK2781845.1 energy-converting hydrogenase subunit [Archaeoglobi archaeon]